MNTMKACLIRDLLTKRISGSQYMQLLRLVIKKEMEKKGVKL